MAPLNLVWMFPDTLRAESFSSYGFPLPTTPNLDEFAKDAVRFEQTHALHTQCTPSRVAMLTGRYMHVLGHRTQTHLIQPYEFNYFQILKQAAGVHVQYYGKNDAFSADSFNQSVSWWSNDIGVESGRNAFRFGEAGYYSMLATGADVAKDDESNGDYAAVKKANAWMASSPPEPFLLFLPGRGAHPPYGAPREFNERWQNLTQLKAAYQLRPPYRAGKPLYHDRAFGVPQYRNLTTLSVDDLYRIHATYLGMISYTDWIFGELLRGIKAAGLYERTAVFFSSDHGDFAGDYRMVEKWPGGADDVLTRVPLFVRIPGGARGIVSRAPVSLFDVPHTMCELQGLNVTGGGDGRFGVHMARSLLPTLLDGTEGDLSRVVHAEGGFASWNELHPGGSDHVDMEDTRAMYYPRALEELEQGSPKWVMARNLTHKLVYRSRGISELYDLSSDPRELHNLYGEPRLAALQAAMTADLLNWLVDTADVTPMHTDPRGPPTFPHAASACATSGAVGPAAHNMAPSASTLALNGVHEWFS